jgi:hypothetical protein
MEIKESPGGQSSAASYCPENLKNLGSPSFPRYFPSKLKKNLGSGSFPSFFFFEIDEKPGEPRLPQVFNEICTMEIKVSPGGQSSAASYCPENLKNLGSPSFPRYFPSKLKKNVGSASFPSVFSSKSKKNLGSPSFARFSMNQLKPASLNWSPEKTSQS